MLTFGGGHGALAIVMMLMMPYSVRKSREPVYTGFWTLYVPSNTLIVIIIHSDRYKRSLPLLGLPPSSLVITSYNKPVIYMSNLWLQFIPNIFPKVNKYIIKAFSTNWSRSEGQKLSNSNRIIYKGIHASYLCNFNSVLDEIVFRCRKLCEA